MPEDQPRFKVISMFKKQGETDLVFNPDQEIGGKAHGLLTAQEILVEFRSDDFSEIKIDIPNLIVIGTSVFDAFMHRNRLSEIAFSNSKDSRIAHAFQQASLPFEILGDLRKLIEKWTMPLAVRSSGLLEDTKNQPFAGVYATKMISNNALNFETRFQKLVEAIKFVWASTYFMIAKDYSKAVQLNIQDEKMAIIIQKMVGERHQNRYYPELSGVARSYNFYPIKPAVPEDGVVNLALGLGKTVVDGDNTWTYSPTYPKAPAPFKSTEDLLHQTQNEFWVVNMSEEYEYNPVKETEYMQKENLLTAEKDGILDLLVSTFELQTGRLSTGMGDKGPRVLTFAPLLEHNFIPINDLLVKLLEKAESKFSSPVEIEFAMTFNPHQFSLLQVRPMKVQLENFQISDEELTSEKNIITSKFVLGNGVLEGLRDIVYVHPKKFDLAMTRQIAKELEDHNKRLLDEQKPYILIVFGRLGTLDPWLGIPVTWGKICGAKVIVEATQENVNVELSQGSHYFHNIINLDVKYFSMPFSQPYRVHWQWLEDQEIVFEDEFTRHIRLISPLTVKVDGKTGIGCISLNE